VKRFLLLGLLTLVGCQRPSTAPMPLAEGARWNYAVFVPPQRYFDELKVGEPISVAGTNGFEVSSNMGVARLGWKNGILYASQTANARFEPALPLYTPTIRPKAEPGKSEPDENYRGTLTAGGETIRVTGRVFREEKLQAITANGVEYKAILCEAALVGGGRRFNLKTWFVNGIGIVQQEQRINGRLLVQLQMLPRQRR
jgi:hypothetical protein